MSRVESYVLHIGLDLIHFRTMIWVYTLYLMWNFVSLKESLIQASPFMATQVYLDAVDIVMVLLAASFAMLGRLWLERFAVIMLSVNGFGQQILRLIFNLVEGMPLQVLMLVSGLAFSILYLSRALTLTYKIANLRSTLEKAVR